MVRAQADLLTDDCIAPYGRRDRTDVFGDERVTPVHVDGRTLSYGRSCGPAPSRAISATTRDAWVPRYGLLAQLRSIVLHVVVSRAERAPTYGQAGRCQRSDRVGDVAQLEPEKIGKQRGEPDRKASRSVGRRATRPHVN